MTVNQDSKRLAIDWAGFDIANDESVTFRQPDRDSVALNRVVGDAASVIDGALSGNGHVYVINPNGVLFGKNASVDVGSLVASTARISNRDMTNFAGADGITMAIPEDSSAKVINAGTIRAEGGLVVLHAAEIENSGTITNPAGTTALAAARNLSLSADTAGKINFTVDGALAKAKALNSGMFKADGGYLVMTARSAGDVMSTVVNNTSTMEAKTLRQNEKGEILLDGGDNGVIELSGTIDASGMEAGQSAGSIKAIGAETHVKDGATLHATGAVDGGLIETSDDYLEIGDTVDIDAAGKTGEAGEWLLDPLEVIIAASKPSGSEAVTNGNTDGSYTSSNTASGTASRNKITWVNSATVNNLLNKGTAVSVQATDANKVASITVNSAINKTQVKDTSLTLEAQRNVTVNAGIASSSGALNVNLHSDTDGDGLGAVLINADIATNGGAFTSGSGTTIESGSVGTYFGNQGETGNRNVKTNGGAISLYGDVAIGLNGGTLTLDMRKGDSASGAVTVTGTVDSGNSYKRVSSGLEGWEDFVKSYYDDVISKDKSSRYRYTRYGRVPSYDELSPLRKSDLSSYLAVQSKTWAGAKAMAQGATKGTNNTGDTYLATITTALENSLASQAEEYQLIVGGRGSGKATTKNPNPADPEHPDGYYWVTGPEGMANDGKGTKFANNDGSAANNFYVKWNNSYSQDTGNTEKEPNNSGPIVSIGFGTASNWDDVSETAGTIRGFVQEKNLAHSGLIIHAGDSKVDIAGNLGNSVALKNVEINAGDVAIGSGSHYTGIVHSDEGVSITGKNVTVGDRITADTKGVDIQATGDIHVDGITSHENINLTTTNGSIVLDKEHNDGSLHTASQDNDAVVIDVQGAGGSFRNLTSADVPAITTGEGGNWKVYSYSPDADKFGTNLNSGTNAQWGATSTSYSASQNDGNKYIFQVQPTVYVTANDMTKVYGEELTNDDVTTTAEATFTGQDNKEHNVNEYTNAFNEGDVADYYNGSGTFTSEGWAKTATRTGGDKAPASEPDNKAIYNIKAASDSYNLTDKGNASGYKDATTKNGGTVEILRRQINVNGSGNQTYGNATINDWTLTATLTGNQEGVPSDADAIVNDDKLDESTDNLSIKSGSLYADNKRTRTTANANENPYEDAVNMENVGFVGDAGVNYKIVNTKGDLTVNKANLTIHTDGFTATYGDVDAVKAGLKNAGTLTGLTNGDENDFASIVNGTSAALSEDGNHTNHAGSYVINAEVDKDLQSVLDMNYKVENKLEDAVITPYTIKEKEVINPDGSPLYTTKYGQKDSFGKATFTGVNGDGTYELTITDSSALKVTGEGKVTQDVGKNIYDTTVELSEAMNGNYQFAGGVTSKTFENTASVTPAELTIETKGVETEYGTVKTTTSEVDGLTNGDLPTGFIFDYGDYGGAYLDGNTKTNDVNTYHFGTTLSGAEFLKNYTITGGEADVKIDPKDVMFFVSGTGNTLTDVTYTVDPDIDAQLAYGEHVDADYTPGNDLGSNQYGVVAHINGTPIVTGDVAGNYRYNYEGLITLSPTVPTKPDIDPHNPSNLDGSGSWTSNMGNHGVPGVERVAGLASAELPFFKVEAGQVSHYGTYDVAADPDKVRLEPTGKRLPEPNQPKTQYREYTKALTTTDGTGMFRMVYDGSVFRITPIDDAALALVRTGDVKNNVELSAEALHAGFSEMGILLEDLDGVYVHFENLH
ncbi:filamentous hemagglutinin N-terminal domain-containing protein [uncultured Mitsuokella sp.]|uniref:two-partner secretion domain-containing protein n=1 Tax=uncultured Mitsuokella sp. TaxID=453120 RepID=UPI0034A44CF4